MEVSNTGFFPAYPALAWILHRALDLEAEDALLITAQAAALGFWIYFFLFGERWNLPFSWQLLGALAILAHPAAFFLITAYSESLFLMALIGFLYWSGAETRRGRVLAAIHGIVMSATRIVGLPCALAPLIKKFGSSAGQTEKRSRLAGRIMVGLSCLALQPCSAGSGFSSTASSAGGIGIFIC